MNVTLLKLYWMALTFFFTVAFAAPSSLSAQEINEFISPDGQLKAVILSTEKVYNGFESIQVEIKQNSDNVTVASKKRHAGRNGELMLEKAVWTQDSQFFVYSISTAANGMQYFINFYDRSIQRLVDTRPWQAMKPDFEILNPDIIKLYGHTRKDRNERWLEVKLSTIPKPFFKLEEEQSHKNYTARTYRNSEDHEGYVEILKDGKTVFKQGGYKFSIGLLYKDNKEGNGLVAMGKDITGQGVPNLIISEWSGGAHCCLDVHVFEIGDAFRKIAVLDARDGDLSQFEKRGTTKGLVFIMSDFTTFSNFGDYWCPNDFVTPPATEIILRYSDGKYRLAIDLMRKPAPSPKEIANMITELHGSWDKECDPPTPKELWRKMMALVYSGNAEVAWKIFDRVWPTDVPGKAETLQKFKSELEASIYFKEIKMLNSTSSPQP